MDGFNFVGLLAVVAVAVVVVLYVRLSHKNKRLKQLADEANNLRREAAETQLRNNRLKQEMTSNIAHELKTPVSSIRGYLEILLSDRPIDPDKRRFYTERCYSQTLRLSELLQDVSMINKMEEASSLFPRTACDVGDAVREAVADLAERAALSGTDIRVALPNAMPIVGNSELLYSIFRNLIENAIVYAGTGAHVVLELYEPRTDAANASPDQAYYLHLYDDGVGVPGEFLSRIFDRFARIDDGRSRRNGGTGLGLSIVKHAVGFHGGEIYAKNRPSGGLEFYFSLLRG